MNFGNEFCRNVINVGVDNNSSSHTDNRKIIFVILGKSPTYGINGRFGSSGKNLAL